MDAQIRRLVVAGAEQNDLHLLSDAFDKLKQNFQVNLVQSKDSIGQDIYVLLAESALDLNANTIADECLQMFFSSSPVKSQFVGRAYLCQFRMYMPKAAQDFASLSNAVPFLQKCLAFALASPRYQFLIYNASVIYFNCVRPFFRDGFRKHLCSSFQQVVDTLVGLPEEHDFLWQAELLFELVRCYIDAKNTDKARQTSTQLLQMCQSKKLPLLSNVVQFLIVNKIMESDQLLPYAPNSDPSSLFNRILIELASIHRLILENQAHDSLHEKLKAAFDRIVALPTRSAVTGNKSSRDVISHQPQTARAEKTLTSYEKHRLLIDAGRLSLLVRYTDLTKVILDALGEVRLKEPEYLLEVRLIQAEYMVKHLGDNEQLYNKSSVDTRMRAIELTEETLESLVRTGQDDLVQTGCINLWNLCLPLLQTNLRGKIRKALTTLVHVLERIQSLNWSLRSQAHFELAKIEEDIEQLDSAKTNLLKARQLDDLSVYSSRIDLGLERLRLRCELYKVPENIDDRVGIIIEQAGKATHGNKNKQRALLIEACLLLAQDGFQVVLDSENPNAIGKMRANPTAQLKGFAEHYEKCLQNTVHYERLMGETDQDKRLKLWADLTMMARRQEIWDVCRTAARFCLLFDNESRRALLQNTNPSNTPSVFQRDLIRLLAEIHFIAGEAEIEFIRERRIELFDTPIRPPMPTVPAAQRAQLQQESDDDWKHYCQWLQQLSTRACAHFSTGAILGQLLQESWLVCRAGEYIWNYTRHLFYSSRLRSILEPLSVIVATLKKIGHEREILLLVNLCVALANAYITPLPISPEEARLLAIAEAAAAAQPTAPAGKRGAKSDPTPAGGAAGASGASSTAVKNDDLKAALEICEYGLHQTKEDVAKPRSVPIGERQTLLQLWVTVKQQLQQSIRSALSAVLGEEDENTSSLNTLSRAVIAVDMLSRIDNGWQDNKDGMNLKQAVAFVDQCVWLDSLVELQLWCRLGIIANRASESETTLYARNKTLHLITLFQTRKVEKFQFSLANEYVSRACAAHAECLLRQQTGQKQERKEVLAILVEAASYASKADLYELTMHIARYYWNTCRSSIKRRLERSLLLDSLNELVHHINGVAPKSIVANLNEKDSKEGKTASTDSFKPKKQPLVNKNDKRAASIDDSQVQATSSGHNPQEDAQIRSALYGVLVQIYMDRHSWHSALDVIDSALQVLPRTHHRLLLYKYRVLIKSKLGLSISMDMQKFREQGELALARMWRQVALMAKRRDHVINAFQRAIETLQSVESYWTKIDYIFDLASWLYSNEYLIDNVIDLIEWNIDLLLTSSAAYQKQANQTPEMQETDTPNNRSSMLKSSRDTVTLKGEIATDSEQSLIGSVKSIIPSRQLPDLSIGEVVDVRRLEYLCRCHVLLAFMTHRNQPEHEVLLQKAYWFVTRLWQRGLADSIDINKDAELEAAAAAEALASGTDAGKKQGQKAVPGSAMKKKPASTVPPGKSIDKQAPSKPPGTFDVSTPKNSSEWALFVVNDEVLQTYVSPQAKQRGFNKQTISKPLLSFYYLDTFVRLLGEYGYNHLSLPVLSFMRLISHNLLKCSSMHTYVLLRIQQVCQQLNLLQPMQTVCQLARPFAIRDDDLAASRAEMMVYSKLLAQQHDEEAQFESALGSSRMKSEARSYGTSAYSSSMSRSQKAADAKTLIPDLPGNRLILSKLITRNIWLQTATLLFELNFIQEAKEMLQEVLQQAKTYDDQACEKRSYILLGEIALHEHRFDQAVELAIQGQHLPLDEQDWYRAVLTVTEALRQDTNQDPYKQKKVRALLETSIKRLKSVAQLNVNKIMSIAYAASLLTLKQIEVEQDELLRPSALNTVENKSVFYRLNDLLQQYDLAYADMLNLNRYPDACDIILTRSIPIWKRFARDAKKDSDRRVYLCRALLILEQLSELLAERWRLIRGISSQSDLSTIQVPTQRQFVRVQQEITGVLLDLLRIYAQETFEERVRRKTTHAGHLAVEDFVGKDRQKSGNEQSANSLAEWNAMTKTLPDKLSGSIMSMLELVGASDKSTKAKVLFYLAQAYSILGQNVGTDYPLEWNAQAKEIMVKLNELSQEKPAVKRLESRGSAGLRPSLAPVDNEWLTEELLAEFNRQKSELHHSMSYLAQSMEHALQSLNIALAIQDKTLIRNLSLLLCDTIGQFDPVSSIMYLALSQNAAASIYTENVLRKACHVPGDSELASLFTLMNRIKRDETASNAINGVVFRTLMERLKSYWAWKYMTIRPQYYDLTKDMPSSFNYLILHYSSDSDKLYAALFNSKITAGKGPTATGTAKQGGSRVAGPTTGFAHPQIMKIDVDKEKLKQIVQQFEQWKQDYAQLLQRHDVKLQHNREKQAMLNSEQVKMALTFSTQSSSRETFQVDHVDLTLIDDLKQQFSHQLLPQLNEYFAPLASLLSTYLEAEKQYEPRPSLSSDHLVLLVDPRLAHLPLEALDIFKHVQIGGISRDFSLQSVYNRLNANIGLDDGSVPPEADKQAKKPATKEPTEVVSELQAVDPSNTYSIVEPILLKSSTDNKASTPFDALRQRYPQLLAKWKAMKQDGSAVKSQKSLSSPHQRLSTVELERIISDAQGVVYYGAHRLSELIGFYRCPTLSKNGCTILCSFDRTSTSSLQVAIPSINNDIDTIELDRSTETALLWSSGGVKSLVLNQWNATISENESVLINAFTDVATLHCSLSQALRLYAYPYFRPVEPDPTTTGGTKDAKGKGNAPANKKPRSPSPKGKQRQASAVTDATSKKKGSTIPATEINSNLASSVSEPVAERQRPTLELQQLNTVVFGLPNLTFTP